jgi:cytoskeletal protein RodZ
LDFGENFMRLKPFWILSLALIALLLPINSIAQTKQNKPSNKSKTSAKKQTSPKKISETLANTKEEIAPTNTTASNTSTTTTSATTTTSTTTTEVTATTPVTPKKKTFENSDIEAYGLAPEVKANVSQSPNQATPDSSSTPNNNQKPNGQGRKGRYGFNVPSTPTPKN